ncbi:succinyl-CoA synthetase beta chain [Lophium mytilinum]|uniref:Succinyl-CoA synthetase beta chain n=1 Tax=Lophium mytilinum TaxID=390894 RepID=A0A6A6R2K7_9PEZI|nr:succinyl-CoA synthetase beta chain [Lophium mytilinum]
MLGHHLSTKQTAGKGLQVDKLYVAEQIKYADKCYLAMTIDREKYCPAIILRKNGGIDIETVAKEHPEQLLTFHFSVTKGITPEILDRIAAPLGTGPAETHSLGEILRGMHRSFVAKAATLLEINLLVRSADGSFTCPDAKFTFDNAAENRQTELNIGNVVNGAGLDMATNDAIAYHGGASANFLDAGGQATQATMQKAFEIILRDERMNTLFVNIYGGIIRPVVRLQGTNAELGLKLVEEADLGLHTESDFGKAA